MAENAAIAEVTKKVEEVILEYVTTSPIAKTTTTATPLPQTTPYWTIDTSLLSFIHPRLVGAGSNRLQLNTSIAHMPPTFLFSFTFALCAIIFIIFSEHGQPLSKNALKKLEKEKLKKERAEKDALARAAQAAAKASTTVVSSSHIQL